MSSAADKAKVADEVSTAIEKAIVECGISALREAPKFMQAIKMAKGIRAMREALTDEFVRHALMPLMGTTLGFLTDLDTKPPEGRYGIQVVRECAIEALIRGFNVVGNEFNIIAGRFYGTKNGYSRLVLEFPGLRNLVLQPGVPQLAGDRGALVPYTATWTLNGTPMSIDCQQQKDGADLRIPVKVNSGMGPDAILGKAERKMLFRIYQRVNGSTYGATDGEVGDEPIVTTGEPAPLPVPAGTPEGKRIKLGGKKQSAGQVNPVASNGAPAPAKDADEASAPTPSASPAGAPADLPKVDVGRLVQMLTEVDPAWDDPDFDARAAVESWSEPERASAHRWAGAVLNDAPMAVQAPRPAHTIVGRQPGED